jgi:TRAP-type C4-dicarboxylate transport system substrate-binding protein
MNIANRPARTWIMLLVALGMGTAACGQPYLDKAGSAVPKPVVLTLANDSGDLSAAQPFADALKEVSHGALEIRAEGPSARLGDLNSETGLVKAVQAGRAQLGITGTQAFDTVVASGLQALQAPFLIDSYALQRKVLNSGLARRMLAALKPAGLVGVALLPGVLARPFGFSRPLLAASDYRRAKIGVVPSLTAGETFRALGATPVAAGSIAELDGIETDVFAADKAFDRPGAALTGNVVFWPWLGVIFMNRPAFASLTAGQQSDLLRAAAKAQAAKIYLGNDTGYLRDLCRRGTRVVIASPADMAGLRAAVQPVYRTLEANPTTKAFIEQIISIRHAMGNAPDVLICPSAPNPSRSTTTPVPLAGTWQVTYTKQQLLGAGADPTLIFLSEESWGHFALRLSSGHWWLRLIGGDPWDPANYRLIYGTYVVSGDKILFHRHDHDYLGSDTEVWGPYVWSVYRDMLTFKKAGSAPMPAGLLVKPWRKTGP